MTLVLSRFSQALAAIGLLGTVSLLPAKAQVIDFSSGFGTPTNLIANGDAVFSNGSAILTSDTDGQSGSFFYEDAVDITRISTTFTFRISSDAPRGDRGDGFTFTINNGTGPTALGQGGSGLGYEGTGLSIALAFDTFNFDGDPEPSDSSVGVATGGDIPHGTVNTLTSGIDLRAGGTFEAAVGYEAGLLRLHLKDLTTNAVFNRNYAVDIEGEIGGTMGFVGFTGGTGLFTSQQEILSWTYASPVPAPSSLLTALIGGVPCLIVLRRRHSK